MSDVDFGGDPARDLYDRWRRGERPDVRAFLRSFGGLSPTRLAAVLRLDQRERWAVGERVTAAGDRVIAYYAVDVVGPGDLVAETRHSALVRVRDGQLRRWEALEDTTRV